MFELGFDLLRIQALTSGSLSMFIALIACVVNIKTGWMNYEPIFARFLEAHHFALLSDGDGVIATLFERVKFTWRWCSLRHEEMSPWRENLIKILSLRFRLCLPARPEAEIPRQSELFTLMIAKQQDNLLIAAQTPNLRVHQKPR